MPSAYVTIETTLYDGDDNILEQSTAECDETELELSMRPSASTQTYRIVNKVVDVRIER